MSEEQYIAVTQITRKPIILAGQIVPIGDGEDCVKPAEIPLYLAAKIIRQRQPKPQAVEPESAKAEPETKKKGGSK